MKASPTTGALGTMESGDGTPVIGYYDKTEGGLGVATLSGTN